MVLSQQSKVLILILAELGRVATLVAAGEGCCGRFLKVDARRTKFLKLY